MCFRFLKYNLDFKLNLFSRGRGGGGTQRTASSGRAAGLGADPQVPVRGSHLVTRTPWRTERGSTAKFSLDAAEPAMHKVNILAFLLVPEGLQPDTENSRAWVTQPLPLVSRFGGGGGG